MKIQIIEERKNEIMVNSEEYSFNHFLDTILKSYYDIQDENEVTQITEYVCNEIGWSEFCKRYCNDTCPCISYLLLLQYQIDIDQFVKDWSIDTELFEMEFLIPIKSQTITHISKTVIDQVTPIMCTKKNMAFVITVVAEEVLHEKQQVE